MRSMETKLGRLDVRKLLLALLGGLLLGFILYQQVFTVYVVEGRSMEPLIRSSDLVFVNRLAYVFRDVERGDLIVFRYPANTRYTIVKRVAGIPEDLIRIQEGYIFVNDIKQYDLFVENENRTEETMGPIVVPKGHYFVVGDNRRNSFDSRVWWLLEGYPVFVPEGYIVGEALLRILPLSEFGIIRPESFYPRIWSKSKQP